VFDAGLRYDEQLKLGYEDWAFFIDACCQKGYQPKPLGRAVFCYRRWGYSMLNASDARREEILEQLRRRLPIYQDHDRLLQLKREVSPYFAIAARGPSLATALEQQKLGDFRIVDDTGLGAQVLVSLDDHTLGQSLQRDRFLLEKLARACQTHDNDVVWLVAVDDPGTGYPGQFFPEDPSKHPSGVIVGVVIRLETFRSLHDGSAGLIEKISHHVEQHGRARLMIVGRRDLQGEQPGLPLTKEVGSVQRSDPRRRLMERASLVGQGLSKIVRGVIGPEHHDQLWKHPILLRLQGRIDPALAQRRSPNDAHDRVVEPLFPRRDDAGEPALLIALPWIVHGGVEQAVIELLKGVRNLAPAVRCYVATTLPEGMSWADEVLPLVDGYFHLPSMASSDLERAMVDLIDRLGISTLLIENSGLAFDSLPLLRLESKTRVRVVAHLHNFDHERTPRAGYPVYATSRYNNLIDGYVTISRWLANELCTHYYASPAKVQAIHLGIDLARFSRGRASRLEGRRPLNVLWMGRLTTQKDPLVALAFAKAWKQRFGADGLHLTLVGSGPLAEQVHARWLEDGLQDIVTLAGPIRDPLPSYRAADCLLLTSRYEGIPVVVYEAMAAGLPIITPTRDTAIGEVLSPDDAYFIADSTNVDEYVATFAKILSNPGDARGRGQRCAESSVKYARERYARELLDFLFKIL
jgi:glycosyltransferase involved in cell wall biosynthesis